MIKEFKGNLLDSDCDIVCHQVNLQGVMGGGLALQIATKYPNCEKSYQEISKEYDMRGDIYFFCYKGKNGLGRYIANCFSQNEDFTTNYEWLESCVEKVINFAKIFHLKTVGIPKNYGCGIAKGNWEIVKSIWTDKFKHNDIELQIWEY